MIAAFCIVIIYTSLQDMEEVKTKCYDRDHNKIEGLSCIEKQYSINGFIISDEVHLIIVLIIIWMLFISVLAICFGAMESKKCVKEGNSAVGGKN